jgi:hypothetical protein
MRTLVAKWHKFCVREKGHLVVAGGYLATTFWHSSAVMSTAYGIAALMATHAIHHSKIGDEPKPKLAHRPKHLVDN